MQAEMNTPELTFQAPDLEQQDHGQYTNKFVVPKSNGEHGSNIPESITAEKLSGEDMFLVGWNTLDDPKHPRNWTRTVKWTITIISSVFVSITLASSTMVAPALPAIGRDLSIHGDVQLQLCLSVFVLGYAFGPFLWAPLSELYGRFVIIQAAMSWFCLWNLISGFAASKSLMIGARLLAGIGGSASLAVGSGINADIWAPSHRGRSLAIAALFPLLGPAVGPICGGYISQRLTWNWIFYIVSMFSAVVQLPASILMRETHAPTLLRRKAKALRVSTGDRKYHFGCENGPKKKLYTAFRRPVLMLVTHPIIQLVSFYGGYSFGVNYIVISTFPDLWINTYHETVSTASLNYISLGLGFVLGAQVCGPVSDHIYQRLIRHKSPVPEMRTPLMLPGALLIPIGLLWYGWSAQAHLHWIMPNIGIAIFGIGQQLGTQCTQAYLIEAYGEYAASSAAAVNLLKSIAGFSFPLAGPALYRSLGWGWGNSLLALISVSIGVPMPFVLWKFGAALREKAKHALPS